MSTKKKLLPNPESALLRAHGATDVSPTLTRLRLTHLDPDFSGRASADEFDKAVRLRPNVSALHASEVSAGLNPASAHWDRCYPWPAALRYICAATHTGNEFISLQSGLWCDYYPTFSAGIVCLPEPIILCLRVILMNCFFPDFECCVCCIKIT